jgi:Icc protein
MKIIQISDLHLYESEYSLMDMGSYSAPFSTEKSFLSVYHTILQQEQIADLVIVTGDIAEEPASKTYQRLAPLLNALPSPYYCIAGNHDRPDYIKNYLKTVHYLDQEQWRIIFLDSSKINHPDGHFSQVELQQLEIYLQTDRHILITMHHHPIPIHSQWMDNLRLQDADKFLNIINRYSQVKAVAFGHIHQAFDETHQNIRYLGTVSTCIQFHSHQENMLFSSQAAGYREINLHADGSIETTIHFAK